MSAEAENEKFSHGGFRPDAGRKSKTGQKTVVKRIPESLVPTVNELIFNMTSTIPHSVRLPIDALWLSTTPVAVKIPFSLDKIPAGFPSPAEPYIADYIDFNEYLVQNQAATFTVRSGGVSMLDAGIDKDDLLLIDRSKTPRHGDFVMADLGNEFTIKRLHLLPGRLVELHSENAVGDYPNFSPKEEENWSIVGVVTFVIKDVRRR
jgi:DNA polymerase V